MNQKEKIKLLLPANIGYFFKFRSFIILAVLSYRRQKWNSVYLQSHCKGKIQRKFLSSLRLQTVSSSWSPTRISGVTLPLSYRICYSVPQEKIKLTNYYGLAVTHEHVPLVQLIDRELELAFL